MSERLRFAWCFSHGQMHRFGEQPWCTASWTYLAGESIDEAVADKHARFGDAEFDRELTREQYLALVAENRARREATS